MRGKRRALGSDRRALGSNPVGNDEGRTAMTKQPKDLTAKSPTTVKGGGWLNNDNITLVRAAS